MHRVFITTAAMAALVSPLLGQTTSTITCSEAKKTGFLTVTVSVRHDGLCYKEKITIQATDGATAEQKAQALKDEASFDSLPATALEHIEWTRVGAAFVVGTIVMADIVGIAEGPDMTGYNYLQGNLPMLIVALAASRSAPRTSSWDASCGCWSWPMATWTHC